MRTDSVKKYVIPNIPYLFIGWACLKLGTAYRLAPGVDLPHKLMCLGQTIGPAFADFAPGLDPLDWLIGIVGAVGFRLLIYAKSKKAKKYRRDEEYGSARWGGPKDIAPFVDPVFENNVILTGTEFLTMNTRPKNPANARNLNACVIGSSGSGKTRFWLTPQILQASAKKKDGCSFVVVDPKGGVLSQVGAFLQRRGYKIKVFNSIDFSKSMHYNPLAYIRNEADVLKWFTVGTKIYGQFQSDGTAGISNGFNYLYQTTPGLYPGSENAWGRPASNEESPNANNIFAQMAGSDGTKHTWRINGTLYAKIRPYKGLSIEGTFNYSPTFKINHTYSRENGFWDYITDTRYSTTELSRAMVTDRLERYYRMTTDLLVRYDETFGDHSVGAILGYSASLYRSWGYQVRKQGATDWMLNEGGTYSTLYDASYTSMQGWGLRSYFARLNYAYKDRYLFEANFRADGSSRFGTNNRYGFFPSFSAGWKIDEEPFMADTKTWLSHLKLRASWGQTGNNLGIGNFAWQATYSAGNVVLDSSNTTSLYIQTMSNINLQWETTTTTDIGIDAGFFNDRLTAEVDYYYKNTTDILFTPSTYLTMGKFSQVPSNLGSMWNQGIEIALNWKDTIGDDFYYYAGVNFSFNKNMVTSFKGKLSRGYDEEGKYYTNLSDVSENWSSPGKLMEGHEIGEHYIYQRYRGTGVGYTGGQVDVNAGPVDGIIRTETDMEWVRAMIESGYSFNGVTTVSKDQLWYGDFIFSDTNGDGNYGNSYDMDFNGKSSTPAYNIGINLGFSWKGIDFSMLWTGAFDYYIFWNSNYYNATNCTWGYAISQRIADDHYFYDPENPSDPRTNIWAAYPRLYTGADRSRQQSDFFEYKGDYMKLKNVQLGYTLPEKITRKFFVKQLRFYVSGENLLTITSYPGMDPELGNKINYPLMRQVSVGAQVTF